MIYWFEKLYGPVIDWFWDSWLNLGNEK